MAYPTGRRFVKRKHLHIAIRATWTLVAIVGGAYVIERLAYIYPKFSELLLPLILMGILALLYFGHLLLDKIMFKSGDSK
jgi:fatty acid desaturase